jgi:histidine phosphotransferase ChpT
MMNAPIDMRILELLCSRLCHELISPVSAIGNGIELLGEEPSGSSSEVTALLAYSSGQASMRLQFYRLAYGFGTSQTSPVGLVQAGELVRGMVDGDKVTVAWPDETGAIGLGRIGIKVILNAALLGIEALPRGGTLTVSIPGTAELEVRIVAAGAGAKLHAESVAALAIDTDVAMLTPRSVQFYFVALLVAAMGGCLSHDQDGDGPATVTVRFPAGG